MKQSYSSRQAGTIMVQVVIALIALLGIAALALDLGHLYMLKTRMQNMVDAAALSGAKQFDMTEETVPASATAAKDTFWKNLVAADSGNDELKDAWGTDPDTPDEIDFVVEFSGELTPGSFSPGGTGPYVRVEAQWPSVGAWFARVLGFTQFTVAASAVAGPSAHLDDVCVFPVVLCPKNMVPEDPDWGEDPLWGYDAGEPLQLLVQKGNEIGPGNIGFLDTGSGADGLQEALAGGTDYCDRQKDEPIITDGDSFTEPGNPIQKFLTGVNSRFEACSGNWCGSTIKPDIVGSVPPDTYTDYQAAYADLSEAQLNDPDFALERRVVVMPVIPCTGDDEGKSNVTIEGFICIFLRDKAVHNAPPVDGSQLSLQGEVISACEAQGTPGSTSGESQLYKIVLHDDPDSSGS